MALNLQLAEAYVQITARNEQFRSALAQARIETEHAVKGIQDKFDRVRSIGRELVIPFAAMTAAVGGVVKVASDVESAFLGVAKVLDGLADSTGKMTEEGREMREEFMKLARAVPVPVEELMRFGAVGGQLGIAKNAVVKFSETMARLKVSVEGVDMETLALQMARITSVMKISQNDVDRLGSVIVELGNRFAAMEGEIVEAATDMLGFAKLAKLSASELLGFAAGAKAVGAESAAVSTALQKVVITMRQLIGEAGEAGKLERLAEIAGMTGAEFREAFGKDSANAILAFLEGLRELEAGGGDAIAALDELGLADARLIRETLKLAGGIDVVRDAIGKANAEWGRNTALIEESERRFGSFQSTVGRLRNAMKELLAVLGEPIMERLATIVKNLTENLNAAIPRVRVFIENLGPMLSNLKDVLAVFVGGRENLDAFLGSLGKISAVLAGTVAAIFAVGTALSVLGKLFSFVGANISLVLSLLGALLSPIVLLPAALLVLYTAWVKNWGGIREFTENVARTVIAIFDDLMERAAHLGEAIGPFAKAALSGTVAVGKLVIDFASDAARAAWEFLQREWNALREQGIRLYIEDKVRQSLEFLHWLSEQPVVVRIFAVLDDALEWLRSVAGKTLESITITVRWTGERIGEFLASLGKNEIVIAVRDTASAVLERIVAWWNQLASDPKRVLEVIVESGQKAIDAVITTGKIIVDFASDAARSSFEWLQTHWSSLRERGIGLSITLAEGAQEWFARLRESELVLNIRGVLDESISWVRDFAGKTLSTITIAVRGIPEWFKGLRESVIEIDLRGKLDQSLEWLRSVGGGAVALITVKAQGIPDWLGRIQDNEIVITVRDAATETLMRIRALWDDFAADPKRVLEIALEAGEGLLEKLQQGMSSVAQSAKDAFGGLRDIDLSPAQRVWDSIVSGARAAGEALLGFLAGIDRAIAQGVEFERQVLARWGAAIRESLGSATEFLRSGEFVNNFVQGFKDIAHQAAASFVGIFRGALIGAEFIATLAGDIAKFIGESAKELAKFIVLWREEVIKTLQDENVAKEIVGLGKAMLRALFEGLRAAGGLFNVFVELIHLEIKGFVTLGEQIGQELWKGLSGFISQQEIFKGLNFNLGFGVQLQDKTEADQTSRNITDAIVRAVTGAVAGVALKPLLEKAIPGSTWIERIAAIGIPVAFAINFIFGGEKGGWEDAILITGLIAANIMPVLVRKIQDSLKGQAGIIATKLGGAAAIAVGIGAGIIFNFMQADVGDTEGFAEKAQRAITAGLTAALAGFISFAVTRNALVGTISAGLVLQLVWDKLEAPQEISPEWQKILAPLQDLSVQVFPALAASATKLAEVLSAIFVLLRDVGAFNIFSAALTVVAEALGGVAGVLQMITGLLTGDWAMAWAGAGKVLDGVLGIILEVAKVLGGLAGQIAVIVSNLLGLYKVLERPISKGFFASLFDQIQQALSGLQPEVRAKLTIDTSEIERVLGTQEVTGLRDFFKDLAASFPKLFAGMTLQPEQQKTVDTISRMMGSLSQGLEAYTKDQKLTADELRSLISVAAQIEQNLAALPPDLQNIVRDNATIAAHWQSIAQSLEDLVRKFNIPIERRQRGGIIPGMGRGDRVPALLEPGEYVVPRSVIERNPGIIAALEAARLGRRRLPGFKRGGWVKVPLQDTSESGESMLDLLQANIWQGVPDVVRSALSDIADVLKGIVGSLYNNLLSVFPDLGPAQQRLMDSLQQTLEKIQQIGQATEAAVAPESIVEGLPTAKQPLEPFERVLAAKVIDPFSQFISSLGKRLNESFDIGSLQAIRSDIIAWSTQVQDQPQKLYALGQGMEDLMQRARDLQGSFDALGMDVSAFKTLVTDSAFEGKLKDALALAPVEAAEQLKVLAENAQGNVEQMREWRIAFSDLVSSIQTRIGFFKEAGKNDLARQWEMVLKQVEGVFATDSASGSLAVLQDSLAALDFSNALEAGEQLHDLMQQNISLVLQDVRAGEMLVSSKRDLFGQVEKMIAVYKELGLPTKELETTLDHLNLMFAGVTDALKPFREELSRLGDLSPLEAVLRIRDIAKEIISPRRMQEGGIVAGAGIGDKVPALLEPGEFVIRREVAQKALPELLMLNAQGFQEGGLVTNTQMPWSKHWEKWASRLGGEEEQALLYYITSGFTPINKYLRGTFDKVPFRITIREVESYIEALDTAIAKGQLPIERLVHRGFGSRTLGRIIQQSGLEALQGLIVRDPAYLSTSLERGIAYDFFWGKLEKSLYDQKYQRLSIPDRIRGYPPYAFLAGIELPAGASSSLPGVLMSTPLTNLPEKELLLPRGSTFEITKAKLVRDENMVELMLKPIKELPAKATNLFSMLLPSPVDIAQVQAEEAAAWLIRSGRLPADYAPSGLMLSELGDLVYNNKVIMGKQETLPFAPSLWDLTIRPLLEAMGFVRTRVEQAVLDQFSESFSMQEAERLLDELQRRGAGPVGRFRPQTGESALLPAPFQAGGPVGITSGEITRIAGLLQDKRFDLPMSTSILEQAIKEGRFYPLFLQAQQEKMQKALQMALAGKPSAERLVKEQIFKGLSVGIITANEGVRMSEQDVLKFIKRGEWPAYMASRRVQALESAAQYATELDIGKFAKMSAAERLQDIVDNVTGLAHVKGAFSLNTAGLENLGTLDIWMSRTTLGEPSIPRFKSAEEYLLALEKTFGDVGQSGIRQWNAFFELGRGAAPLFGEGKMEEVYGFMAKVLRERYAIDEGIDLKKAPPLGDFLKMVKSRVSSLGTFSQSSHAAFFQALGLKTDDVLQAMNLPADAYKKLERLLSSPAYGIAGLPIKERISQLAELPPVATETLGRFKTPAVNKMFREFFVPSMLVGPQELMAYHMMLPETVPNLFEIISKYLPGATVYEDMSGRFKSMFEFIGDQSHAQKIGDLSKELAASLKSPISLVTENLSTGSISTRNITETMAEAGERLLDALGLQGNVKLYTERFENLSDLTRKHFEKFNIRHALGLWEGQIEKSAVIEIALGTKGDLDQARRLAEEIASVNKQQAVMMVGRSPSGVALQEFITAPQEIVKRSVSDTQLGLFGDEPKPMSSISRLAKQTSQTLSGYIRQTLGGESALWKDNDFINSLRKLDALSEYLPIKDFVTGNKQIDRFLKHPLTLGAISGSSISDISYYLSPKLPEYSFFQERGLRTSEAILEVASHELGHLLDFAARSLETGQTGLSQLLNDSMMRDIMTDPRVTQELFNLALSRKPIGAETPIWKETFQRLGKPMSLSALHEEIGKIFGDLDKIKNMPDYGGKFTKFEELMTFKGLLLRMKEYVLSPAELMAEYFSVYRAGREVASTQMPHTTQAFEDVLLPRMVKQIPDLKSLFKAVGGSMFALAPDPFSVAQIEFERLAAHLIAQKGVSPQDLWQLNADDRGNIYLGERLVFAADEQLPEKYAASPFTMVRLLESSIRPFLEMLGIVKNRIEEAVIERYGSQALQSHETVQMLERIANSYKDWMERRSGGSLGAQFTPDGFAAGGFTGLGGVSQAAGVVHKGEYVLPAWMVRSMPATVAGLESIRQRGFAKGGRTTTEFISVDFAQITERAATSMEELNEALEQVTDTMQALPAQLPKPPVAEQNTEEILRLLAEEQRKIFNSLRQQIQVRRELGLEVPEEMLRQFRILSVMLESSLTPAAQELAKKLIELDLKPSVASIEILKELGAAAGLNAEQLALLADESRRLFSEQQRLASSLRDLGFVEKAQEIEDALTKMKLVLLQGSIDLVDMLKTQFSKLDFARPSLELAASIKEAIPRALEHGGEAIGVVSDTVSKLISAAETRVRDLQTIGAPEEMIQAAKEAMYAIKEMFANEAAQAMMSLKRQLEGIGTAKTISEFLGGVGKSTEELLGLLATQGESIEGLLTVRSAMDNYRRQLEEIIGLLPPYSDAHRQAKAALEQYTLSVASASGDAFGALQVALNNLGNQETISQFLAAVEGDISSLIKLRDLNEDNIAWLKAVNAKYQEIIETFKDVLQLLPEGSKQQQYAMEMLKRVQESWGVAAGSAKTALDGFRQKLEGLSIERFLDPEAFATSLGQLQQYIQEAIESGNIGMLRAVHEHKRELESAFQELIQIFEGLGLSTDELRQRFAEFAKSFNSETQGAIAALREAIERLKAQPIGSALFGVERKRAGGLVHGLGRGDRVPALLEPGEFVVQREVAQQFLPELMWLNARGYAKGGVVARNFVDDGVASVSDEERIIAAATIATRPAPDAGLPTKNLETLVRIADEQRTLLRSVLEVLKESNTRSTQIAETAKSQLEIQEEKGAEEKQPKNLFVDILNRARERSSEIAKSGIGLIKEPQVLMKGLLNEFASTAREIPELIHNALAEGGPKALSGIKELVSLFEQQQKEWLETLELLGISTEEFALSLRKLNAGLMIDGPKKRLAELQIEIEELLKGDLASQPIIHSLKQLAIETFGDPAMRKEVIAAVREVSQRLREEIESFKAMMGVMPDQTFVKDKIKALEQFLADFDATFQNASKSLAERVRQKLDTLLDFDVLSPEEAARVIIDQLREVMEHATEAGERMLDSLQVAGLSPRATAGSQAEAIAEIAKAKDMLVSRLESTAKALESLGINSDAVHKQMLQIEARFAALPSHILEMVETLDFTRPVESAQKLLGAFLEIPKENRIAQDFVIRAREQAIASIEREIDRRKALGLSSYFLEKDLERARAGFAELSPAMKRFTETLRSEVSGFVRSLFGPLAPVINDFVFNTLGGAVVNSLQDFAIGVLQGLGGMKAVAQVTGSFTSTVQAIADRFDTMGIGLDSITSSFFGLLMQSQSYKRLMEELQPIIQALADVLGFILEPLVDIVRALREFFGITKEVNDAFSMTSANIPVGFKFERMRYAAALPDQPPLRGRGGTSGGIFGPIIDFFKRLTQIPIVGELLKFAFWLARLTLSLIILDKIIRAIPVLGTIYDELVKSIAKPIANWVWETVLKPGWDWFVSSVLAPGWNWFVQSVLVPSWEFLASGIGKQIGDALAGANWTELTIAAGTVFLLGALGGMIERKGQEIAEKGIVAGESAQIAQGRAIQGLGTGIKWGAILGGLAGFLMGGPMGAAIGAGLGGLAGGGFGAPIGYVAGELEARKRLMPAPAMQLGGYVSQTGLALIHAGEYVVPQRQMAGVREMTASQWQTPAMSLSVPEINVPEAAGSSRGNEAIYIGKLIIDDPDLNRRLRDYIRMKNLRQRGVGVSHTLLD